MEKIWIYLKNNYYIIFSIIFIINIICNNYNNKLSIFMNILLLLSTILFITMGFKYQKTNSDKYIYILCIIITMIVLYFRRF